jgi:hypothetical protein
MEWWFYIMSPLASIVFFFCFASDFEKVPMEEDVGHGGMIINC